MVRIFGDTRPGVRSYLSVAEVGRVVEVYDDRCIVQLMVASKRSKRQIRNPDELLLLCRGGSVDYDMPAVDTILRNNHQRAVDKCEKLRNDVEKLTKKLEKQRLVAEGDMSGHQRAATMRLMPRRSACSATRKMLRTHTSRNWRRR